MIRCVSLPFWIFMISHIDDYFRISANKNECQIYVLNTGWFSRFRFIKNSSSNCKFITFYCKHYRQLYIYFVGNSGCIITCSSEGYKPVTCDTGLKIEKVTLIEQMSTASCVFGESYFINGTGISVTDGCRASFSYCQDNGELATI